MRRIEKMFLSLVVLVFLFSPYFLSAQDAARKPEELTKKDRQEVIKKIDLLLKDNYVFPDKALKIEDLYPIFLLFEKLEKITVDENKVISKFFM